MTSLGPSTPYGYTIFCDDIRQETGGKVSYMGIYGGDLIVFGKFPISLPKFGLAISYFERPGESDESAELCVYLPEDTDDTPTLRLPMPMKEMRARAKSAPSSNEGDQLIALTLHTVMTPLNLRQEGRIKVRAYRGDDEIRLGTIRVISRPDKTNQEAPAPT